MAASENYLVRITLTHVYCPVITRTLSVPKNTTFHKFHEAIQIAFGWACCHLYKFEVLEPQPANGHRTHRKTVISLEESPELNEWTEPEPEKSTIVTLQRVWDDPQYASKAMEYVYDFGDNWEHAIEKIGTESGNGKIKCVAGKGHGPAEDCGGIRGWENLKFVHRKLLRAKDREAAIRRLKEDDQVVIKWFKKHCSNGDSAGLDPNMWSMDDVNAQLSNVL